MQGLRRRIAVHDTLTRKAQQIEICLREQVEMERGTGFGHYRFLHEALPEIALDDVDLSATFLGARLQAPFMIASMTGGPERGLRINRNLALAAGRLGIPIAVGSQRAALRHPEARKSFEIVRDLARDVPVYANLGAVQLNRGYGRNELAEAVRMIAADGIFLHLNPLQEAIQSGDTNFRGLADRIGEAVRLAERPVLAKEVGSGVSPRTARLLADRGVAAIDVSGAGGTSWSHIEGLRAADPAFRELGLRFAEWGIPTAQSLVLCRAELPDMPLIASGGMRDGITAAKALALGADMVALALPLVAAADESADKVVDVLARFMRELRLTMFLVGARSLQELRQGPRLVAEAP